MSKRETALAHRARLWALATVVLVLMEACGQLQPPPPLLDVTAAKATSNTSLIVTFNAPVDPKSVEPGNFTITGPSGAHLAVVSAFAADDAQEVALTTEPQQLVSYELAVHGLKGVGVASSPSREIGTRFTGSDTLAPVVSQVVPMTNTSVLVTYADPVSGEPLEVGDSALDVSNYRFEPAGLEVYGAAFPHGDAGRAQVVLTTSPQGDIAYTLKVEDVIAADGEQVLDPFMATRTFQGIAATDTSSPGITSIEAASDTSVVVRFSEPVSEAAADPSKYRIEDPDGSPLQVVAANLNAFHTEAKITTSSMTLGLEYSLVALDAVEDASGNPLSLGQVSRFTYSGSAANGADQEPPRVLGANSVDSTTIVVTFSEPVYGAGDPSKYSIVDAATYGSSTVATQAVLLVKSVTVSASKRSVTLNTREQSELLYALTVTDVTDAAGNQLASADLLHPFQVTFMGTGVSGTAADADGDGLSDAAEQAGWTVTVVRTDGTSETIKVTSDPDEPDTDEDGIGDADERHYLTSPRAADTDLDGLTDDAELNDFYSDPTVMDTDSDSLSDGLEVSLFGTSPLLSDTDGDQLSDDYEVGTDNRNPRIADLPAVAIQTGSVDLRLDVRFEETTSNGTRTLDSRSAAVTLAQSQESARQTETSSTLGWFVKASGSLCYAFACQTGNEPTWGGTFTAEGGGNGETTSTYSNASVRASQREYATTLSTDAEVSADSAVSRVVEGAQMAVEVNITNASNIAFTIDDIEITALVQDPAEPGRFVPVATLFSESGGPISIGPLTPERGPFRFVSDDAYPSLVESLMANPRGLLFRVANYDISDELGRDFAFVEQDVNDRTAFLEINYAGNSPIERYQVATNSTFAEDGSPAGITMKQLLEDVLGLEYVDPATDQTLDPNVAEDADLLDRSYSTRTAADGSTTLYRIKRVSAALTGTNRTWWVLGPEGNITPVGTRPGKDFLSYRVFADQDYAFTFVQDLDEDDLEAIEELLYRSVDSDLDEDGDGVPDSRDTDRDGIQDGDEVYGLFVGNRRVQWLIRLQDGRDAYTTMSHPGRADSDGDGLTDCQELLVADACSLIIVYKDGDGVPTIQHTSSTGNENDFLADLRLRSPTDPSDPDTDGDGITDLEEAIGFAYVRLDGTTMTIGSSTRYDEFGYATNPLSSDTDQDGLEDLIEVRLGSDPTTADGDTVRDDDADGLVNAEETVDQRIAVTKGLGPSARPEAVDVTSNTSMVDTDADGLTDWEEYYGCLDEDHDFECDTDERFGPSDRSNADTDGDGLTDLREVEGVQFANDPDGPLRHTDPVDADSDDDGTSDGIEANQSWLVNVVGHGGYVVWSDPMAADRDGDGVNDAVERANGIDPNASDSDQDGALDGLEIQRSTNPLEADHLITVRFMRLLVYGSTASSDGDGADDAGDFVFGFGVRRPPTMAFETVVESSDFKDVLPNCTSDRQSNCMGPLRDGAVLQLASPLSQDLDGYTANWKTINARATFAVPFTQLFTIEGWLQELDPAAPETTTAGFTFTFGGLGEPTGTYSASDLQKGTFSLEFSAPRMEAPQVTTPT